MKLSHGTNLVPDRNQKTSAPSSGYFVLLERPRQAVDAASNALTQFDQKTYAARHGLHEVRLGHALVLSGEITEATRVLGNAASQAYLYPRLTTELHTTRALLHPWQHTQPVQELDAQFHASGLLAASHRSPRS